MRATLAGLFLCLASLWAVDVSAEARLPLGWGRVLTNDLVGDGRDRWRTGGYGIDHVRGPAWAGHLPERPGALLVYRLRGEVIAPRSITAPAPGDRPFAGVVSAGIATQFRTQGAEVSYGLDLVAVGPQTGALDFHRRLHRWIGEPVAPDGAPEIGNGIYPTVTVELGRDFGAGGLRGRPFVEAVAGLETLLRAGFDLRLGTIGTGDLWLREPVTGQRYRGVKGGTRGAELVLGGDVAKVFDSHLLPSRNGYRLTDTRLRLRAGMRWHGKRSDLFYGVTWLGEEFRGQPEGQAVGSVNLNIRF